MGEKPLTDRDFEMLGYLRDGEWERPIDCGGMNGSHHSNTLTKLAARGLVQFKQRGHADPPEGQNGENGRKSRRGAKVYRITPRGRSVYEIYEAAR